MTAWTRTPFDEILCDSKDGEWGLGLEALGHKLCYVIRGTDFANFDNPANQLPKRWIKDHIVERKQLVQGDVLLETAGGTAKQSTGRSALLRKSFFQRHADHPVVCASFSRYLRLKTAQYDPAFVYYYLQALYDSGYMAIFNIQHTGVSRFQYTSFRKQTTLRMPQLVVEKKIAAILSAYDDLIENNKRRIALLEKMAEEIYREWFVRFRFPGHDRVKFEKGVPESWVQKGFGDFCMLQRGYDLPDKQVIPGPYPVVASTSIKTHHNQFKVKPPVIATGRSGSLGTVQYISENAWPLNTCLYVRKFYGNSSYLVYYTLKNMRLENFNAGAGIPSLNRNHINGVSILIPPQSLQEQFDLIISPLFHQKDRFTQANKVLVKIRDILLPRLISGRLSVENLDISFPPSMEEDDREV